MPPIRPQLLARASVLLLLVVWGCAHKSAGSGWRWPWDPVPEVAVGITTPAQRIQMLREMQQNAAKQSPEQQAKLCDDLNKQIQNEQDPLIRRHIIRTFGFYNTPVSSAVLKAAINDSDSSVRLAACEAWGRRGGKEAADILLGVLATDTDLDVRLGAARAVGKTHEGSAVGNLAECLVDSNAAIQFRVASSLKEISGKDYGTDVNRWRAYAKGETTADPPVSLVDRFKNMWR